MNRTDFTTHNLARLALCLSCALALSSAVGSAQAQTPSPTPKAEATPKVVVPPPQIVDEKAEAILRRAVESLGGGAYLNIKSVTGRGYFTQIAGGVSASTSSFIDYLIYPDRERTDFKSPGVHDVQTNLDLTKGWVFDGMTKTIKDMDADGLESFRMTMRTSIDNLLRGAWRKDGASLSYLGRREAGLAKRNEAVRLVYPDGFVADFEFGARDGLPAKSSYKRKIKTKEGEDAEVTEEDRVERYLTFNGVQVPFTIDHYRDGEKTSRINYESIEFNPTIPDAIFAKPVSPKAIK
ncbi:MAG: hypothetical protein QOF61_661 [Acidobacteriota bacterium]|jgi:hypothetical protein|nr:hypothetical protein [Acidobacteriota bacterium]